MFCCGGFGLFLNKGHTNYRSLTFSMSYPIMRISSTFSGSSGLRNEEIYRYKNGLKDFATVIDIKPFLKKKK